MPARREPQHRSRPRLENWRHFTQRGAALAPGSGMSSMSSEHLTGAVAPPQTRRVDAALRVTFAGQHWSVQLLQGVHVGDLVQCAPSHQGDALFVQGESGSLPGIWASPLEPVHSCLHTCPRLCTPASSGTGTTWSAPGHGCSCPGVGVPHTPQTPRATTPSGSTRSHTADIAAEAPGADSIPTGGAVASARCLSPLRCSSGTGRPLASSDGSLGGVL